MHKISSNSLFIGKKVVHLPKCHSTNTVAADLLASGQAGEGTIVVADYQTAGRGQRGNSWESQPGENLMFSVILKPDFLTPDQQFFLTIVSSLAVFNVVQGEIDQAEIKWPNDIYAGGAKICGILIESSIRGSRIEACVVGIGLNINQSEFATTTATSMKNISGLSYSREELQHRICDELEGLYLQLKAGNKERIKAAYLANLMWLGEWRTFADKEGSFDGQILAVTDTGKLVIERSALETSIQVTYDLKEVQFLR